MKKIINFFYLVIPRFQATRCCAFFLFMHYNYCMFSAQHILWIIISAVLITGGVAACVRRKPELRKLFKLCLILAVISEAVKIISVARIVPVVDPVISAAGDGYTLSYVPSGEYTPFIGAEHLPLELCSLYIVFLLAALFITNEKWKKRLYSLMYVSGTVGGLLGIVLSSAVVYGTDTSSLFASPRIWQYFLYHSMIVTVSIYLGISAEAGLVFNNWKAAIISLIILDIPTFYLNSLLSTEVYVNDTAVGVTHRINFLSSYVNPLGIILTEKWQWVLYIIIRALLTVTLTVLLFLPLIKRGAPAEGE